MQSQRQKIQIKRPAVSLYLKCGSIFLLLLISALMVACGATTTTATNINGPVVTVTIKIGNSGSPTPTLAPYYCGAWVTNTAPSMNAGAVIINTKFTQNVDGNPQGVAGAYAQATVLWADGISELSPPATTTSDGLAIFNIPIPQNRPGLLNRESLVTVTFRSGNQTCAVDTARAAYFVITAATPTPSPSPGATPPVANPAVTPPGAPKH